MMIKNKNKTFVSMVHTEIFQHFKGLAGLETEPILYGRYKIS